jgi:nitrate/nitrite transport system ATP-binding protein
MTGFLKVEQLAKAYQADKPVFADVSFAIDKGEFVCIIGHSGCGKTTILNVLAGLDTATSGHCFMDGREIAGPSLERGVVPEPRAHALAHGAAEHRVRGEVALGRLEPQRDQRARGEIRGLVGLSPAIDKKPSQLSGGMKQRVGIARAFAIQPKMLLLDEPFGALDALTRGTIQDELMAIVNETHQTVFMITHDVDEAILLADRILLMTNGQETEQGYVPGGMAEVVVNPLPRQRSRAQLHHLDGYYELRNHIVDFLVSEQKPTDRFFLSFFSTQATRQHMSRLDVTEKIINTKVTKGLSWADVAKKVGQSKEWTTALCLGQMTATPAQAKVLGKIFGLSTDEQKWLMVVPYKGSLPTSVPTDPLIYRFYELVSVYGTTFKELIHEEFGDGIMSAIDFKMDMQRQADPNGDRVNIVMSGKFLPYKQY